MDKTKKRITTKQLDIFQQLETDPIESVNADDLDIHYELLGAIKAAIKEARRQGLSRDHIVERMNNSLPELDKPITLRQLNAWTAKSKEHSEFPACYIPAFCWATHCDMPLRVLANALLLDLADQRLQLATKLGENLLQQAELKKTNQQIKNILERS